MLPDFIFMLTRNDRTIPDALERVPEILAAGIKHIGIKDIGLLLPALREVADAIRLGGARLYLETVSLDPVLEAASASAALELGADVLMGGTNPDIVLPILRGSAISYYPFPGTIVGHPSHLRGSIEDIEKSARNLLARDGIDGLDLLAYRFDGDVPELMRRICQAASGKPVIIAGSIDRKERIDHVKRAGAAGFTVGTAALDNRFPAPSFLRDQLSYIVEVLQQSVVDIPD